MCLHFFLLLKTNHFYFSIFYSQCSIFKHPDSWDMLRSGSSNTVILDLLYQFDSPPGFWFSTRHSFLLSVPSSPWTIETWFLGWNLWDFFAQGVKNAFRMTKLSKHQEILRMFSAFETLDMFPPESKTTSSLDLDIKSKKITAVRIVFSWDRSLKSAYGSSVKMPLLVCPKY